jgi:glycosyltransferase EpsE
LKKNGGLANALNVCIRAASGEVIARMDCYDISFPESFKKQFHALQKGNTDIVRSQVIIINA